MPIRLPLSLLQVFSVLFFSVAAIPQIKGQAANGTNSQNHIAESGRDGARHLDSDHVKERDTWFSRGRLIRGRSTSELRRRAHAAKLQMRAERAAALAAGANSKPPATSVPWQMLGPVPLASDATGNGTQNYNQVSGRATAVAIDPADPTGNTVYVGGAQGGIWKSTNAAAATAGGVTWTPIADDQATLAIGAMAIQPGNSNPANTVILAATGEADNSSDSYFGLGILRSTNAGASWTLIPTANNGALPFAGLGGTRMAFDLASGQMNTVVAAMATSSEGMIDGAVTTSTTRGLYTSLDAGQTWNYDALIDPGGTTDATSATSVVFNASAGLFFAAVRYHGFYSSPNGLTWTRLATQPSGAGLSTTTCPPQSTSNNYACPIYRAELTVVPGRNEMYAWIVWLDSTGNPVDGGIWQSLNSGASWTAISETTITNCGDIEGCGIDQGTFNLELLAVPDGSATDLYAGAVNLYKCVITSQNPTCAANPFMNLTHVYGCDPIAAPSHVHPDQHALAYLITAAGTDLMYFANDGGIYRALDGFSGLNTGSCTGTNAFDDLNQNLGPMTEFVSFSNHPTDPNTLLAGAQDNGSPATTTATTNSGWGNILGGDGGYNAIDHNTPTNFYASNPDIPPGGLGVQLCPDGAACNDSKFSFVTTSSALGGDDGAFYFPYILDPQSTTAMIIGTCRIWRGPREGGTFTVLSPNFDTQGSDPCSGSEVNQVRAIAAGGLTDSNGSMVLYATTIGLGPIDGPLSTPPGGHIWVATNATAATFTDVTNNGSQGSINPNEFPISAVAIDTSDSTGGTAYITIMGFTGGPGHVWQTRNFGANWIDFTANLPDSPVNTVVIDPVNAQIYVGSDVGVFVSSTASANWTELGPNPGNQSGFLPNVPVTALGLFNSGGEELLRASTYGRGIWQFPINAVADYQLSISNTPLTAFPNQTAVFNGRAASVNGYASSVTLSCVAGTTAPPSTCIISPAMLTPGSNASFTVDAAGATGEYNFDVQGVGSDSNQTTHLVPLSLNVVSFALSTPTPSNVTVPRGTTSSLVDFQVTAAGSFNQSVTVSCTLTNPLPGATCALTPGSTVDPTASNPVNMTASVTVPPTTPPGTYQVTIQATTAGAPATITTSFTITVTTNPDFALSEPSSFPEVNFGSTGASSPISITSQDGFNGTVTLSCPTTFGAGSCSINPTTVNSYPATANLVINGASFAAGSYSLNVTGTSGAKTHSVYIPFNLGDYTITGTQTLTLSPAAQGTANLTITSLYFYTGMISATCDASTLSGTQCTLSPANPIAVTADGSTNLHAIINVPNNAAVGHYNISISTQDATGTPSHAFTIALTVAQDFIVTSTTSSQTVNSGQTTGPYNLNIQPLGASFNSAVTLSCSNLPQFAQCVFDPSAPVTPGNSAANVVMTITTTAAASSAQKGTHRPIFYAVGLLFPGIAMMMIVYVAGRNRVHSRAPALGFLALFLLILPSCAGVSSGGGGGGGGGQSGTPPGTYTVTVTGSSPGAAPDAGQSTQVTLVVN